MDLTPKRTCTTAKTRPMVSILVPGKRISCKVSCKQLFQNSYSKYLFFALETDEDTLNRYALPFHGDESEIEELSGSEDEDEVYGFLSRVAYPRNEVGVMDTGVTDVSDIQIGNLSEVDPDETDVSEAEEEPTTQPTAKSKRVQKRKPLKQRATNRLIANRSTSKRFKNQDSPAWMAVLSRTNISVPPLNFAPPPSKLLGPYQYFTMFIDAEIVKDIVYQTNKYSGQKSKSGESIDVTTFEMEQFLGILLLMGIHKVPSYRAHWSSASRYPPIADVMPRNRFDQIKNFLHFNDNDNIKKRGTEGYDKLFKVRPLIDALKKNFLKVEPHICQSIDEIMIPSKASSPLRQFNRNKPHRFGIKVEGRAGADGILHDFQIYSGKSDKDPTGPWGVSGDVVVKLSDSLPADCQFFIFADNWFSSYALAKHVATRGLHYTGTIRPNRIPGNTLKTDADLKKEGRGAYDSRVSEDGIHVIKWMDNKPISLISTYCGVEPLDEVKRWSTSEKRFATVSRPDVVRQYNQFMGGIDLNDYLVALYRTSVGTKRYYMRIFFHLLDVSVVNAWLLYRRHMTQSNLVALTLLNFRLEIAQTLISYGKNVVKHRGRPPINTAKVAKAPVFVSKIAPPVEIRFDGIGHWPVEVRRERCLLCKKRGSFTFFKCCKCDVPLCLKKGRNCFHEFHNTKT